jgi:hypothetical protein
MIKYGRSGRAIEIWCDVPGCGVGQVVGATNHSLEEKIAILPSQAAAEGAYRRRAEAELGWFLEKMETKDGGILERDICPKDAPGYRTLLSLRNRGT